jgi:two-component system OmpR family response regulator
MEAPARSRASNEAPSPYDAAVRVLVVEDETKMAALIRRALEREGYAVDLAGNGQDGLWMATENRYDAMVLDVMIPSPNGFEVCR